MQKHVKTFPGAASIPPEVFTTVSIKLNESKALPVLCAVCGSRFLLEALILQDDMNQTVANRGYKELSPNSSLFHGFPAWIYLFIF